MATKYQVVLLRTINGDFFVSLPADAAANIGKPELIFEPGSQILAWENAAPAGSEAVPSPFDEPREHEKGQGAVHGEFTVEFRDGGINLKGPMQPGLLTGMA